MMVHLQQALRPENFGIVPQVGADAEPGAGVGGRDQKEASYRPAAALDLAGVGPARHLTRRGGRFCIVTEIKERRAICCGCCFTPFPMEETRYQALGAREDTREPDAGLLRIRQ